MFSGLKHLEVIKLNFNQLTSIDNDTFGGLENLKEIYLSNNKLSNIDTRIFQGLTKLKVNNKGLIF
jgi:Leucine-rich repeat (LRR) protein